MSASERVLRVVAVAEPALTVIIGLLAAFVLYLGIQRQIDRGPRLAWPGDRRAPDDEIISF